MLAEFTIHVSDYAEGLMTGIGISVFLVFLWVINK